MSKLKLQYFGHLVCRADSFEKTLMLGKIEGRRRKGRQRLRWLDGITDNGHGILGQSSGSWNSGEPGRVLEMEKWTRRMGRPESHRQSPKEESGTHTHYYI